MMGDRARRVNSPDGGHAGPLGRFLGHATALERQPAPCADSAPPLNRSHTRRARHDLPVYHSVRSRYNGSPRLGCASGVSTGRRHKLASITGLIVTVRTSKANQEGDKRDVRYLKNGCASAIRRLRDRLTVLASGIGRPAPMRYSAASTAPASDGASPQPHVQPASRAASPAAPAASALPASSPGWAPARRKPCWRAVGLRRAWWRTTQPAPRRKRVP